jgi:hypothetical protein
MGFSEFRQTSVFVALREYPWWTNNVYFDCSATVPYYVDSPVEANQPDGFDCPGCAWPDPRGGAAASSSARTAPRRWLAEATTTARTSPEFFASARIAELRAPVRPLARGRQGR